MFEVTKMGRTMADEKATGMSIYWQEFIRFPGSTPDRSQGVSGPFLRSNAKSHKLRIYVHSFRDFISRYKDHCPENRSVFIFMIFRAGGNVNDLLKPLLLTLEPPDYSN